MRLISNDLLMDYETQNIIADEWASVILLGLTYVSNGDTFDYGAKRFSSTKIYTSHKG